MYRLLAGYGVRIDLLFLFMNWIQKDKREKRYTKKAIDLAELSRSRLQKQGRQLVAFT